jgi:tRNA modification GTPase
MEAVIDFGDDDREGDISEHVYSPLIPRLDRLLADLDNHLQDGHRGEIVREGLRIVLTGPPNAGGFEVTISFIYICIIYKNRDVLI